jgi:hypothetical protein
MILILIGSLALTLSRFGIVSIRNPAFRHPFFCLTEAGCGCPDRTESLCMPV